MEQAFQFSDLSSYAIPALTAGFGYMVSKDNRMRNTLVGAGAGLGLMFVFNYTASNDVNNFLNNRRLNGPAPTYADRDTALANLTLTPNGIADLNPVLPRPTETVDVPNAIDLPGGKVLLIPAPTSWDAFPGGLPPNTMTS
jgi:hypothetical protein